MRWRPANLLWLWTLALAPGPVVASEMAIELLGEVQIDRRMDGSETPVGGLSALSFDAASGRLFAVSDDSGRFGPARIYELRFDWRGSELGPEGARAVGATILYRADRTPFPHRTIDAEGLARTPEGHWIVASEGFVRNGVAPALFEFTEHGEWVGTLRLPRGLRPRRHRGPRHNLALESATLSPDGRWLFTATESALLQDGDVADGAGGALCRILRYEVPRRRRPAAFAYRTEPIAAPPEGDEFAVNGLVDLLALDGDRLLALERSFTAGRGNAVRLFYVDLGPAADVSRVRSLGQMGVRPARKTLLVDIASLGVLPDNIEGMALGPQLADGRRVLLLVADDNFSPDRQRNQLIVLALQEEVLEGRADAR